MLAVNLPIGLGDSVDVEEPVISPFAEHLRPGFSEAFAIYATVDDRMRDMNSKRPIFSRHALADHSQAGLRRRELGKSRFAAQARGGARENHRAPSKWNKTARRLAADKEAAETADAPKVLELLRRKLPEIDAAVVARIKNDEVGGIALFAAIEGLVEQADDVGLAGRIGRHRFRAAAGGDNGGGDLVDFLPRSAADQHVIAF